MTGVDTFTEALRWVVWLALAVGTVVVVAISLRGRRRPVAPVVPLPPGRVIARDCTRCVKRP